MRLKDRELLSCPPGPGPPTRLAFPICTDTSLCPSERLAVPPWVSRAFLVLLLLISLSTSQSGEFNFLSKENQI